MLNVSIIQGRLTKKAEMRKTQTGKDVATFTLACDKGKDAGADFVNCVAWDNTARFIEQYFNKGDMCLVTGRLQSRNYEDSNGNKRTAWEIIVRNADFCGSKKDNTAAVEFEEIDGDLPF